MTSYFFRCLVICVFPLTAWSQITDDILVQPSINLSWHNNARWSFNSSISQRTAVQKDWNPLHIQAAQFASYEIGFYTQLGVGIMYRELLDQAKPEELRFTEQFVHARKYNALKIAHRLRWDQRWREQTITHRWRYRLSGSLPLNGSVTDASELYLTGSIESLFIAENGVCPAFDQRFTLGLGKKVSSNLKLQFSTQYRFEDFTDQNSKLLFLNFSAYYSM